jgi:hypothetical protein
MDGDGDESPISIDAAEHNHLQLILCVNELKEHNGRSENLLSRVAHFIKEQVSIVEHMRHFKTPKTPHPSVHSITF